MKKYIIILLLNFLSSLSFSQINSMRKTTMVNNTNSVSVASNIVKEGVYYIKVAETNKFLAIEGISQNNGARLVQWDFAANTNHQFLITAANDGYYFIKAIHSNKYLNVVGQSIEDGALICQWDFVNQDNLKWSFYYNKTNQSYTIKNKQSGKELKLLDGITNTTNGAYLSINGNANNGSQSFFLVDVKQLTNNNNANSGLINKQQTAKLNEAVLNNVYITLKDGTRVTRSLNPNFIKNSTAARKRITNSQKTDEECETKTARIDMETKDYIPVTASTFLRYNQPGLIYDIKTFYSGDYSNKQLFPNGENRNPITIATTVLNTNRSVTENVQTPTINSIFQGISNLQSGYTLDRLQTTNQSLIYKSTYVESNTEMQMKIGASGRYMMASFESDMQIKNTKETKTFYIEADKEMFSLAVDKPQNGFLDESITDISNYGYISQVTYGVKVIGKIEVDNTEESLQGSFKAMVNAGFAEGKIDFAALSRESHKNVRCFFYVVGGMSEKVTGTNLSEVYYKINEILASVNYKTCMPIRMEFRSLATGSRIAFKDATNDFKYEVCVPKAIKEADKNISVKIQTLTAIGTDIELYGNIWMEVWSPKFGDLKRYRTTNNYLFTLKQDVHLEKDQMAQYPLNLPTVMYKNIPAAFAEDAEVHIYYGLLDYNTVGSNDVLKQRGGVMVNLGTAQTPRMFYRTTFKAKDLFATGGLPINYATDFVDGDGVTIGIQLRGDVETNKK
ncbi:MAG: RICIN domain-containing protein [Chitinophagaceae bacterium]